MGTIFKYTDSNGRIIFSDSPPDPHKGQKFTPSDLTSNQCYTNMFCGNPEVKKEKTDYEKAKEYIAAAQKHIPKIKEYLEVLSYLKNHDEAAFKAALNELQAKNPKAWISLQKSPLFKDLKEIKQFENNAKAGSKILSSQATGKAISSDDFMDAWYARIKTNAQQRGYVEGKPNLTSLATSRLATRAAAGVAINRVGGTILQAEMMALDPQLAGDIAPKMLIDRLDQLSGKAPGWSGKRIYDDSPEWENIRHLIGTGKYIEAKKLMDDWVRDHR